MIDQTKIESYKEAYGTLKEMEQLKDFRYPKQKKHLDFSCVAGDTIIKFRLFSDRDLLQLRAEQQCNDMDDRKNGDRIHQISEKYNGVFGTAYDGNAILNMSVPLSSIADDVAKKLILDKTKEFAEIVINEMADLSKNYNYKASEEETVPAEGAEKVTAEEPEEMADEGSEEVTGEKPIIETPLENKENEFNGKDSTTLFDAVAGAMSNMETSSSTVGIEDVAAKEIPENESEEFSNDLSNKTEQFDNYSGILEDTEKEYDPSREGELSEADKADDEMKDAVQRQIEQQNYRENILQEMRDLIAREKAEVLTLKQEATEVSEKNRAENERLRESWNKYHTSNRNLDKRTSAVSKREKKAMDKELELAQREKEIKQREAEANTVKMSNEEKSRELEQAIERNHTLLQKLEIREESLDDMEQMLNTKKKALDVRQERIEMDRQTIEHSFQDMYAMENMLKEMKGKIVPADTEGDKKQIKTLKAEKEQLQGELKKATSVTSDYRKRLEEAAAVNNQLQGQVQKLNAVLKEQSGRQTDDIELTSVKSQLKDATQRLLNEQHKSSDLENEMNELKRKNNELNEKLASAIKTPVIETLASAGYTVSPIAGEGNQLLTFELDGCTVIIDEHLGMVCLEKKVKRNHVKTFDIWNSQSFAETYCMSKGKAYCRFAYENLVDDIRRIAAKLNTLK